MAASDLGTAHLYGVAGTQSNCTVLSFRRKTHCANKAQTEDESGNVIERRRDDVTTEATITIRQQSAWTPPAPGDVLTYNTEKFEVEDIEKTETNKGFRDATINLINSAGITLA